MACVLVEARYLARVRRETAELAGSRARLHFHEELNSRRRSALEAFTTMPMSVQVVVCHRRHRVTEFQARDACLSAIVLSLQAQMVPRLTIESRQDDRDDRRTIARSRLSTPPLVFEHRRSVREPLLWIADAIAWAYGAGGSWLPLVRPLVDEVTDLRP
jgi:hypothetical protein